MRLLALLLAGAVADLEGMRRGAEPVGHSSARRELLQGYAEYPAPPGVVRLGLLLPMSGWSAGKYTAGAATLAIADINADDKLMAGRRLEYIWEDSGCSSSKGISAMSKLLERQSQLSGVSIPPAQSRPHPPGPNMDSDS